MTRLDLAKQLAFFAFSYLVVFRLVWLVIEDLVTKRYRDAMLMYFQRRMWWKAWTFVQCPWCIGFWIGVAYVAVLDLGDWWSFPMVVLWPFAINMLVGPSAHVVSWLMVKTDPSVETEDP